MSDRNGLAVLATRARVAMVVIGSTSCLSKDYSRLSRFTDFVSNQDAYVNVNAEMSKEWSAFCLRCLQQGHDREVCKHRPTCSICSSMSDKSCKHLLLSTHTLRHCTYADDKPLPESYCGVEQRPNDEILRSPLVKMGDRAGKPVKHHMAAKQR